MQKLFVVKSADGNQHLIASLSKDSDGNYGFTPLIPSEELIPALSFPLLKKAAESGVSPTQKEIRGWIKQYAPPLADKELMKILLEKKGLAEYDEWEWLKTYKIGSINRIGFCEEIPEGCITHTKAKKVVPVDVLIEACDKLLRNGGDYDISRDIAPYIDENTSVEEALAPYLDPDSEENFKKKLHSKMEDFLRGCIGKSAEDFEDNPEEDFEDDSEEEPDDDFDDDYEEEPEEELEEEPEDSAPKKITAEEFVEEHRDMVVRDKEVIECIYKNLAQTTLSAFCKTMRIPRCVAEKLENNLRSTNSIGKYTCVDELAFSGLIDKFVVKTGFGKAENKQYSETTIAVYTALTEAFCFGLKAADERKG